MDELMNRKEIHKKRLEFHEKYKDLIEAGRRHALMIIKRHEEMCLDLGDECEDLTISEREHYIKENEKRHSDWLYFNIK